MKGLFGKYIIQKANGEPIDPEAKYFVLRYDKASKDYHAKEILFEYARRTGNKKLEQDLKEDQPNDKD